jgi:hypothetical protein
MSMRVYKLEGGGGAKGAALAIVIVGVGVLFVGVGLALLLLLGTAGALLGAGVMAYRRLTRRSDDDRLPRASATARLDPSLEVFGGDAVIDDHPIRELPESNPPR